MITLPGMEVTAYTLPQSVEFATGSNTPFAYRLCRRAGEVVLQGCFRTLYTRADGVTTRVEEAWQDIPTVDAP